MKSEQKVVVQSGGVGLGGLLFVLFLALKLTGVIAWPWVWVFAPLWAPIILAIGLIIIAIGITCLVALFRK